MSDSQIPKATMSNFIRQRIKGKKKISAEFIQAMLDLSKEYIDRVGAISNEICEKEGKKTINSDHFYKALKQLHMDEVIPALESTEESLRKKQQVKQQTKQKVQANIQRRKELNQESEEEQRPLLQEKNQLKPIVIEDDEDFEMLLNEDQPNKSH